MWLPAAFASAVTFGIGGFLLKVSSYNNYPNASVFIGLYLAGSLIFFSALLATSNVNLTPLLFAFSILIGLGSYFGNSFLVKAYDLGPASITSPLMNISILFVIILSTIVYQEKITHQQYFGIALMITGVTLIGKRLNDPAIKSRMWLVFVLLAIIFVFMREGGLKIAHENGLNNLNVLLFGYLFASILAFTRMFAIRHEKKINKHALLLGTTIGVFSAIGMGLLAYAIERGPAAIIIPIFSTRNFVAALLVVIFFKEKLAPLQWAGLGLLLLGIVLIT